VYHGFTLTSKILFHSICLVVKNYLDANPDTYPIILSLENHCSHPFQLVMAQDMEQVFGSKLFIPSQEQIGINQLPSPEELRGKIVIKGKRPPELDDSPDDEDEERDADDPYSDQYKDTPSVATKDPKKLPKVVPELAKLTQFHGNKFKDFQKSIKQNPSHMHSFGESKITKIINKDKANANFWREYNVTHMSRTYPAGIRVDSSNYSPVLAWSVGCRKL
jgi:phosphatidylinositol phospholipase C delta